MPNLEKIIRDGGQRGKNDLTPAIAELTRAVRDGVNPLLGQSLASEIIDGRVHIGRRWDVTLKGARLDGSTDNASAIRDVVSEASTVDGGGIIYIPPSASGCVINSAVKIEADNLIIVCHSPVFRTSAPGADEGIFEIAGSVTATTTTLSASGAIGDTSISVNSISGFAADDWIEIESDSTIGGTGPYLVDIQQIESTAAGTLNLKGALRHDFDTATPTVTVRKINVVRNSHIIGPALLDHNIATDQGFLLRVLYGVGCSMRSFRGINHRQMAFRFERSVGCVGEQLYPESTLDPSGNGYGVQIFSSHECTVRDSHGRANRHSFDIARGSTGNLLDGCTSEDDTSDAFVIGHGQAGRRNIARKCTAYNAAARGFQFGNTAYGGDFNSEAEDCRAIGCATGGFRVHAASVDTDLTRPVAYNNGGPGIRVEGTDTVRVTILLPYGRNNTGSEIVVASDCDGQVDIVIPNLLKTTSGIVTELAAPDCSVTGGKIRGDGTPSTGVRFNGVAGRIVGTFLDNFANRCVQGVNAVGVQVLGTKCRNAPTGIQTTGTADKATVVGNDVDGLTTPISLAGSNNVVRGNQNYDDIQQTYTPTNVTTDRSYDANSTTVDELADVLGTLIADLKGGGVLP